MQSDTISKTKQSGLPSYVILQINHPHACTLISQTLIQYILHFCFAKLSVTYLSKVLTLRNVYTKTSQRVGETFFFCVTAMEFVADLRIT